MKLSCSTEGVVISEENSILLKERLKNIDLFRRTLVRKRQDRLSEVVAREGRPNAVADTVKCIFGFDLENDGCLEKTAMNCEICHAFCCELHTPHETHQAFVTANPHILLRQQIAATAAEAESNAVGTREQPSAASTKQPGKNTKPDLCNRYKAVTGKMAVESKYTKLKVAEFRVIVEELERAKGIFVGPAAANRNASQSVASILNSTQTVPPVAVSTIQPTAPALSSNPITQLNQLLSLIQSNPNILEMMTSHITSSLGGDMNQSDDLLDIGDEEIFL